MRWNQPSSTQNSEKATSSHCSDEGPFAPLKGRLETKDEWPPAAELLDSSLVLRLSSGTLAPSKPSRLRPAICGSVGAPATSSSVAVRSSVLTTRGQRWPAATTPGHETMSGT